jgi:hypothetical protein
MKLQIKSLGPYKRSFHTFHTGKTDVKAPWSVVRLALCQQYTTQIGRAAGDANARLSISKGAEDTWLSFRIDECVFSDEKHKQCVIGCN